MQFKTYTEATEYFGIKLPRNFIDTLLIIDKFCQDHQLDTLDFLFELCGLLRIEGKEARYQQTPIEFFPFSSIGSDGIHYGFVIHTLEENDYPSGEICPMDDDGVVLISNTSNDLIQSLVCDTTILDNYPTLFKQLNLINKVINRVRYDANENPLRVSIPDKKDWRFISTKDGVGVFAENKYFSEYHQTKYNLLNREIGFNEYLNLANKMKSLGLYASQLYYLKELYWHEWPNYVVAKELLVQMLDSYEKLNRQHLFETTKWVIDTFDQRYGK